MLVLLQSGRPHEEFAEGEMVTASGTVKRFSYDDLADEYGLAEAAVYEVFADEEFLMADKVAASSRGR